MRSTFMGLETAKRGMFSQQSALYVTGNNISNANTLGYSRQRVNFTQTTPYPSIGMNRPQLPGQMGTGVAADSIQRIRDEFIDSRYRLESNKLGYYATKSDALSRMEDILNEPTEQGLSSALDKFWNSLQVLGSSPNESGARESVLAQANSLADTFNYLSNSLDTVMRDLKQSVSVNVDTINSLTSQINSINKQIAQVEPHGDLPNALYDERDRLVDELSSLVNIKVTKQENGGIPSPLAEGVYKIEIISNGGASLGVLVDTNTISGSPNKLSYSIDSKGFVESLKIGNGKEIKVEDFSSGSLKANIEAYGYVTKNGTQTGEYPDMIDELDKLAFTLVKEFNTIHQQGTDLNGSPGAKFFDDLFQYEGAAKNISVIITDPSMIAAAASGQKEGNGNNAYDLAEVLNKDFSKFTDQSLGLSGDIKSFYAGVIASLGVKSKESIVLTNNTLTLLESVNTQRQSVSSVSLDEEMTDMIKFQHAYNASARNITMIDEMLDTIINGMGRVGR